MYQRASRRRVPSPRRGDACVDVQPEEKRSTPSKRSVAILHERNGEVRSVLDHCKASGIAGSGAEQPGAWRGDTKSLKRAEASRRVQKWPVAIQSGTEHARTLAARGVWGAIQRCMKCPEVPCSTRSAAECRREPGAGQNTPSDTEHGEEHLRGCTRTEATSSGMQLCAAHGAASSAMERYPGTQSVAEYHEATGSSRSTWSGAVRCIARRSYTEKPERHGAAQSCTERCEAL